MFAAPTTLSDLLAAEREAIQRGRTTGPPSAYMPSMEELKMLHDSVVASTKKEDDRQQQRFLKHSRAHHPHLDMGHGTAVRVSQEAAQREKELNDAFPEDAAAPAEQLPREGVAISGREWQPGPQPVSSLRATGALTYESQGHKVPPSGFRQALARCYANGGRLSATSIPSANTTQQQLETMRRLAKTKVDAAPSTMLNPDQYHRAAKLLHANRAIEVEQLARETERAARGASPGRAVRGSPGRAVRSSPGSSRGLTRATSMQAVVGSSRARGSELPVDATELPQSVINASGSFTPGRPPWNRMSHSCSSMAIMKSIQPSYAPPYPFETRATTAPSMQRTSAMSTGLLNPAGPWPPIAPEEDVPGSLAPPRTRSATGTRPTAAVIAPGEQETSRPPSSRPHSSQRQGTPPRMARDVRVEYEEDMLMDVPRHQHEGPPESALPFTPPTTGLGRMAARAGTPAAAPAPAPSSTTPASNLAPPSREGMPPSRQLPTASSVPASRQSTRMHSPRGRARTPSRAYRHNPSDYRAVPERSAAGHFQKHSNADSRSLSSASSPRQVRPARVLSSAALLGGRAARPASKEQTAPSIPAFSRPGTAPMLILTQSGPEPPEKALRGGVSMPAMRRARPPGGVRIWSEV